MSKTLAIKGRETRGNEVIKLLEMMGGKNCFHLHGLFSEHAYYFIGGPHNDEIRAGEYIFDEDDMCFFTLEEFWEKYPFRVGEKVNIPEYESEVRICKMRWNSLCEYMEYMVYRNEDQEWYTAEELLNYNDNPLYLFNPHDIVVVESYDKKQKWICEYKSYDIDQLYFYRGTYDIHSNKEELMYESFYDIAPSDIIRAAYYDEITKFKRMIEKNNTTNHMPNVLAELLEHIKTTPKEQLEKEFNELEEWANVGPTVEEFMDFCSKVNKKPKYPKTYEECCDVIGINRYNVEIDLPQPYQQVMFNLFKLRICRDAYWKIVGEEMGLGKPWEPNWNGVKLETKYVIYNQPNAGWVINTSALYKCFLTFPTPEMRDAFYENFKDLIEQCKELL